MVRLAAGHLRKFSEIFLSLTLILIDHHSRQTDEHILIALKQLYLKFATKKSKYLLSLPSG